MTKAAVTPLYVRMSDAPAMFGLSDDTLRRRAKEGVFTIRKRGGASLLSVSEVALLKALNALNEPGRPHGFRSSFRMWVQDTRACDYDVAETVLAHQVGGKVERTYARSDLLDERAAVMSRWADFATGIGAVVVTMRAG